MHVVIVDQSRVAAKSIGNMLRPKGYVVDTFCDSREALSFIGVTPTVTAVLTSLEVQPLSGLELCWQLRLLSDAGRPLYVIAISSIKNDRNLAEALDSGADDFMGKPPSPEELYARLRAGERLTRLQRDLIRFAEADPLTGLLNRRAFMNRLQDMVDNRDSTAELALLNVDIDRFKAFNDAHGHDMGDALLQAVAGEIGRGQPLAARIAGGEFTVLVAHASLEAAEESGRGLKERCARLIVRGPSGPLRTTVSVGVSAWAEGDTPESFLKRAGVALFEAKRGGGDQVVSAAAELIIARTA